MQYVFLVHVTFIAVSEENIESSSTCRLPQGQITLPNITIEETKDGHYRATMRIQATDLTEARLIAVDQTERFLKVLAVSDYIFIIDPTSVDARLIQELDTRKPNIQRQGNTVSVIIEERIYFSGHIGILKRKNNLDFEVNALLKTDNWPEYLRRGVNLNYSAVRAATDDVRFLLLMATLEILAWKKLGSPESLLKASLSKSAYSTFKESLQIFFRQWNFNNEQEGRLTEHLLATHKEPVAYHLIKYLASVGITDYSIDEVMTWWRIRGKLAHGDSVDAKTLRKHISILKTAIQSALREEINHI